MENTLIEQYFKFAKEQMGEDDWKKQRDGLKDAHLMNAYTSTIITHSLMLCNFIFKNWNKENQQEFVETIAMIVNVLSTLIVCIPSRLDEITERIIEVLKLAAEDKNNPDLELICKTLMADMLKLLDVELG